MKTCATSTCTFAEQDKGGKGGGGTPFHKVNYDRLNYIVMLNNAWTGEKAL